MSCQDIFESIEREMVGELADDHEGDQPGPGNPSRDGLGRDRWTGHAVATLGAGVLGQDMDLHFQLRRDEIEFAGEVLADFWLGPAAAGAGLLVLGQIMLDADVREMVQAGSPWGAGGLGWLGRRLVNRRRHGRLGFGEDLGDVEEMTLARVVGKALAALAEEVAAQQGQGLGQLVVLLLQLLVIRRGLLEHAFEFVDAALCVFGLLSGGLGLLVPVVLFEETFDSAMRRCASSACCRNSSLRRSRSSSNRWPGPGS